MKDQKTEITEKRKRKGKYENPTMERKSKRRMLLLTNDRMKHEAQVPLDGGNEKKLASKVGLGFKHLQRVQATFQ